MELESLSFDFTEIFDGRPKTSNNLYSAAKPSLDCSFDAEDDADSYAFLISVLKDDKTKFVPLAKRLIESERSEALRLLSSCCGFDSINCASSLINGDVGAVPYINDVAADTGLSPLHTAAENHSPRCVEMLLKRRARTDVRSKDERALLPLELSLSNGSLNVTWNPNTDSIGNLILLLGDKDLTVVKLLAEKTKEMYSVANSYAKAGGIIPLTALLIVAPDKIREATASLQDDDSVSKPKITIYETVIQEALRSNSLMQSECCQKRITLLREIELLQLFGAAVFSELDDKQSSLLFTIVKAGDEAVLELLLNTNIDVNETDAEGNSVLQCCLKGSSVPHKQQTRIMRLLIAHGARFSQRNNLGLSAVHFAAANGNLSALEILLAANPEVVHIKTVIKETPLFYAVKNNHLDCVELLLRYGASTEIHNLRKQRPIELTQSQDMRFLLSPTNISCFSKETELAAQLHQSVTSTKSDGEETSFQGNSVPPWLKRFIKWFPRFLREASESWTEIGYPLSSLKADFRSVFGMELDHSYIGFPKLIDFIKSFPTICELKAVPIGKSGSATHWVILPIKCSHLKERPPEPLIINNKPNTPPEPQPPICSSSFIKQQAPPLAVSYSNSRRLQHPVLETFARNRNSTSLFFLREFDFYQSYESCLREGMCFWCNKSMLQWANFPCRHKLWCTSCKQGIAQFAASGEYHHRCVVCDAKVETFVLTPPFGFDQHKLPSGLHLMTALN